MTTLPADLERVLAVISRAKAGMFVIDRQLGCIWSRGEHGGVVSGEDDLVAICAAVNFMRDYAPALRSALKDAERYRWLRKMDTPAKREHGRSSIIVGNFDTDLDAAIDAARAQEAWK